MGESLLKKSQPWSELLQMVK